MNREGDWEMNDGSATQSVCQRKKCMSSPQLIFGTLATLSQHWILGWDPYILGLSPSLRSFPITFWGDYLLRISNHFKSVISCQCFCKYVLLCLRSKSPELRKQDIHGNANAKREFIASSSQDPGHIQHSGIEPEPRAQDYSGIYRFRTKTGNWQGWIGYKGFFASTNWLDFHTRGLS